MKTRNTLLTIAIIVANLSSTGKLFAEDNAKDANIALEVINNKIETFIKFQAPNVEIVEDSATESNIEEIELMDRETLEDLTAVPWMIKEVIVSAKQKIVNVCNDNIVLASISKCKF